jgi:hypothetical protein
MKGVYYGCLFGSVLWIIIGLLLWVFWLRYN